MRIFNWVQNKLIGKQEKKRFDVESGSARHSYAPDARKEEFSDWPEGLLAIGTFGNKDLTEESPKCYPSENSCAAQDPWDFTIEEVIKLQKELAKVLALKPKSSTDESERASLPLNRFLNCPSSLEVDLANHTNSCDDVNNNKDGDLSPRTEIILNKAKDVLRDNRNAIKRRSISFLFKKIFACSSGFAPSLKDPIPESRMEKILRAILHNKMYHQNSNQASMKKYLEDQPVDAEHSEHKMEEKGEDGQWVRTDSEYIVLEI